MKPTTPKPTEEHVQAAMDWLKSPDGWHALGTKRQGEVLRFFNGSTNAANNWHAAHILASALAWERWEAQEDKARLEFLINDINSGKIHDMLVFVTEELGGGMLPVLDIPEIDAARKGAV